jgi:hypothetical protein
VEGVGFDQGPIEIRWNGSAGPELAKTNGPTFSTEVTIPESPEGLYALIVLARKADGSLGNTGTAAFQVKAENNPNADPQAADTTHREPEDSSSSSTNLAQLAAAFAGGVVTLALGMAGGVFFARRWPRDSRSA